MAVTAAGIEADRLSRAFARLLGQAVPPKASELLGLEHEYSVERSGRPVDFTRLIHRLAIPGRRIDAADPNAYRCYFGGVITCDGAEAEVAIPPVVGRPGFADELVSWADLALEQLRAVVPPEIALHGYSTHLSAAVPDALVDATALLYVERFAPALMLLLDRPDSPGLLVRPRPGRLELGGEYAAGPVLRAAATFVAGSVRAATLALRARSMHGLPPAIASAVLPSVERFGWYVDRAAFGTDLYRHGRTTRLRRRGGGETTGQRQLEAAWQAARAALDGMATRDELALVDDIVAGRSPLAVEAGQPSTRPGVDTSASVCESPPRSPFGALLDEMPRPGFEVRAAMTTWSATTFEVRSPRRTFYALVPRDALPAFLARVTSGALDSLVTAYIDAIPSGRRLERFDQTATPSLYDTVGHGASLIAPERTPLVAWGYTGRPGKQHGTQEPPPPRNGGVRPPRPWVESLKRLLVAFGILAVLMIAGGVIAVASGIWPPTEDATFIAKVTPSPTRTRLTPTPTSTPTPTRTPHRRSEPPATVPPSEPTVAPSEPTPTPPITEPPPATPAPIDPTGVEPCDLLTTDEVAQVLKLEPSLFRWVESRTDDPGRRCEAQFDNIDTFGRKAAVTVHDLPMTIDTWQQVIPDSCIQPIPIADFVEAAYLCRGEGFTRPWQAYGYSNGLVLDVLVDRDGPELPEAFYDSAAETLLRLAFANLPLSPAADAGAAPGAAESRSPVSP